MKKIVLLSLVVLIVSAFILSGCTNAAPSSTAPATSKAPAPAPATSAPPASSSPATSKPAASSPAAAAKVIELKFAHFMAPTHDVSKAWEDFSNEIGKRTNGKVKITFYPGGSLLSSTAMADGIQSGIADMGFISSSQNAGRFPVDGAIPVSIGFPSAYVASHVQDDFLKQFKPKELASYHLLAGSATGPMSIWTKSKPVRTLADLKGMKIRDIGTSADRLQMLGASTVGIGADQVYDSLSKGVIDGCSFPIAEGLGWKVAEVAKYATRYWQASSSGHFFTAMNINVWNGLPPDIQSIFDQTASEWVDKNALAWNNLDIQGAQYSQKQGVQFVDLTADEIANWQKAQSPLKDKYIQTMVSLGFTKDDTSNWFTYIQSRTDYWLQQQIKLGIKSPIGPKEIQ